MEKFFKSCTNLHKYYTRGKLFKNKIKNRTLIKLDKKDKFYSNSITQI